jgi:hypothetical protein
MNNSLLGKLEYSNLNGYRAVDQREFIVGQYKTSRSEGVSHRKRIPEGLQLMAQGSFRNKQS